MDTETFLKRAAAQRVLRRAGRVAQTAITVHAHMENGESDRVAGCGSCAEACAYVQKLPWGAQACRKSREKHAAQALARGRTVPFLCHMGFGCVVAPLSTDVAERSLALTFGPFCPAEAPGSLEQDAFEGLARLEQSPRDALPFSLSDIPNVPAGVPAEVADWLTETLTEQRVRHAASTPLPADTTFNPDGAAPRTRRRKRARVVRDDYGARTILGVMSDKKSAPLRRAVLDRLSPRKGRDSAETLRARSVAVAAAIIEAAEEAGIVQEEARKRLAALPESLAEVTQSDAACRGVLKTIAPIRRGLLRRSKATGDFFTALEGYVLDRLTADVNLTATARQFALPASTLTRRVQRKHGLTFTGYVARLRVQRAKHLLTRTRLNVDDIARRVGLTDGAHLRKLLHRFEGTTPSEVRASRVLPRKAAG